MLEEGDGVTGRKDKPLVVMVTRSRERLAEKCEVVPPCIALVTAGTSIDCDPPCKNICELFCCIGTVLLAGVALKLGNTVLVLFETLAWAVLVLDASLEDTVLATLSVDE